LYQANVKNSKGIISLNYKDSSSVIDRSENIVTFGGDNEIDGSFNTQVIGQTNSVAGAGQSTIIGQDNNTNINVWYEDSEYAQEHLDDLNYFSGHLYNTYIFGQGNSITAKINDVERRNAIAHNTIVGEKNNIRCGTNIIQVNNNKIFAAESEFEVNNFSYNTILGFDVDVHNNAPSSGLAFTQNLLYGRAANGMKITGDGNFSRNIIFGSPSISFTSDKSADAFAENFIVSMGYQGNEGITANGNFCRNIIMGNNQTANYTESAAFTDNFIIGKGNEIHFIPNEGNSGIM
jgi:hypothetical protein